MILMSLGGYMVKKYRVELIKYPALRQPNKFRSISFIIINKLKISHKDLTQLFLQSGLVET